MVRSGRPRKDSTDQRILDAFAELVVERGYARVTVDEVVARAGTNKPAFYRRFRNLAAVVPRLLASRHGTDEDIDTGTIVGDLIEVQRRQRRLFTDPVVVRGFAGWIAEVDVDPAQGVPFLFGYLAPRRAYTRVILDRAVSRGEIAADSDPGWIADLLTGPLIMRAILPGMPPIDDLFICRTVHAALDVLGYVGDRGRVPEW
ncbi:MAG: TetR/AcrR family transcriptional regulator [Protaetiibacter sp.]